MYEVRKGSRLWIFLCIAILFWLHKKNTCTRKVYPTRSSIIKFCNFEIKKNQSSRRLSYTNLNCSRNDHQLLCCSSSWLRCSHLFAPHLNKPLLGWREGFNIALTCIWSVRRCVQANSNFSFSFVDPQAILIEKTLSKPARWFAISPASKSHIDTHSHSTWHFNKPKRSLEHLGAHCGALFAQNPFSPRSSTCRCVIERKLICKLKFKPRPLAIWPKELFQRNLKCVSGKRWELICSSFAKKNLDFILKFEAAHSLVFF